MKASEIIRKAIETYYARVTNYVGKSEYMCHAIEYQIGGGRSNRLSNDQYKLLLNATETFMPTLHSSASGTLSCHLKKTNRRYAGYVKRWGHSSNACFKIRVAFWENHIAQLEAKGL